MNTSDHDVEKVSERRATERVRVRGFPWVHAADDKGTFCQRDQPAVKKAHKARTSEDVSCPLCLEMARNLTISEAIAAGYYQAPPPLPPIVRQPHLENKRGGWGD